MAGYRTWTDDDYLSSDDVNTYLVGLVVCRFASTTERDAQLGGPAVGQICYVVGVGFQQFLAAGWVNLVFPAYTTALRPLANTLPAGTAIFDTTLGAPVWSTGTAWVPAGGAALTLAITGGATATQNTPTPVIAGTATGVDGATVTITVAGHVYGALVSGGAWTLSVPDTLPLGTYGVVARVTAPGGTGTATQSLTLAA